jgi:hypothetical protein
MKITTSLENINTFGVLNFVSNEFESLGLAQVSNNQLAEVYLLNILIQYFVKNSSSDSTKTVELL